MQERANHAAGNVFARAILPFLSREPVLAAVFCVLVFALYAPALNGPFVYDDFRFAADNPQVHINQLSLDQLIMAASSNRPLTSLSMGLNFLAGGHGTLGFHLVNVLIHFFVCLAVYLLFKTTLAELGRPATGGEVLWPAAAAAALWGVHPLATETAAYISQRANSLAALFFVLTLWAYSRGRLSPARKKGWSWFFLAGVFALAAVGSKENGALVFVFVFLFDWFFFRDLDLEIIRRNLVPLLCLGAFAVLMSFIVLGRWPVNPLIFLYGAASVPLFFFLHQAFFGGRSSPAWLAKNFMWLSCLFILSALALAVWKQTDPVQGILYGYQNTYHLDYGPLERVMTQVVVVFFYLTLLVFPAPSRLNLCHDFPVSRALTDPLTLVCLLLLLGAFILALLQARRHRLLSFAVLWFFGNLAMESSIINLDMVAEHRTYIPSIFLFLAVVSGVGGLLKNKAAQAVLFGVVFLASCNVTYSRASLWGDDLALWTDCIEKSPGLSRPYNNLGVSLMKNNDPAGAVSRFEQAIAVNPHDIDAVYNLGMLMKAQNRVEEAFSNFERAIELRDDYFWAHNQMGIMLAGRGRLEEAITHYQKALEIRPDMAEAHNNLGVALISRGDWDKAHDEFQKAVDLVPNYTRALGNLATTLVRRQEPELAVDILARALKQEPSNDWLHGQMGNALIGVGNVPKAIVHYQLAITISPSQSDHRNGLAVALTTAGRLEEAQRHYQKALEIIGDEATAQRDMSRALAGAGASRGADVHALQAKKIQKNQAVIQKNMGQLFVRMGDAQAAQTVLEESLALNPVDGEAWMMLGVVRTAREDLPGAQNAFDVLVEMSPDNALAHRNLGLVLARQGENRPALQHMERALELDPENQDLKKDIRIIKKRIARQQGGFLE